MQMTAEQAPIPLTDSEFDTAWAQYEDQGYVIFPNLLSADTCAVLRAALAPHLDHRGRNDFEGLKSNRVYGLLGKSPAFATLAIHPIALAFAEKELGQSCLLSACLAINLLPGETVQPWHTDDGHIHVPAPRQAYGVSAFWTLDDTTELNGATEVLPGSHRWGPENFPSASVNSGVTDTRERAPGDDPSPRSDAVKATMPAGSLMIAKGTLWHRGGANLSDGSRLIVTPQYSVGWARPLETQLLAVPPDIAASLPQRARELVGYSIHPPFMGYVDGMHPARTLAHTN